ncbi:MAG: hemagglutinin protein [Pedosphaera sp.]|nr:hemagglutinin protein [Pedosphaera sp.]
MHYFCGDDAPGWTIKTNQKFMKNTKASSSKVKNFEPGEHIRVVPLHHPKPSVSIDEQSQRRREGDDHELFDGKPHPASANAKLTYRNGPLLENAQVFTVFWGNLWGGTPISKDIMNKLNQFFADILVSPLIDQLAEYNVSGKAIGHGTLTGTNLINANAPVGSVTDSMIKKQLKKWIQTKTVPKNTKNTLYFIYLDPGVISILSGSKSCQNFCGYHNNVGNVYYAVMPYPTCSGCLGGMTAFDALTGTSSHELCEAITDPVPGAGWYDDVNGEIGDICAWNFKKVDGYTVQLEWSNEQGKCV